MKMLRRSTNQFRTRVFGRGRSWAVAVHEETPSMADDLRLFILTFGGGFLFMTIYLI